MDESPGDEIDKNEMENTVLHYNHEHKRKLELGKVLLEIVINREVDEDLYLKKSVESFPVNIEFKPPPLVYAMANCHGHRHGILPWPSPWHFAMAIAMAFCHGHGHGPPPP